MSTTVLIATFVLAFLGLLCALLAWFVLYFMVGRVWALLGFNAVLFGTCFLIIEIATT